MLLRVVVNYTRDSCVLKYLNKLFVVVLMCDFVI